MGKISTEAFLCVILAFLIVSTTGCNPSEQQLNDARQQWQSLQTSSDSLLQDPWHLLYQVSLQLESNNPDSAKVIMAKLDQIAEGEKAHELATALLSSATFHKRIGCE